MEEIQRAREVDACIVPFDVQYFHFYGISAASVDLNETHD